MAYAPSDRVVRRIPALGVGMLLATVLGAVALTRGPADRAAEATAPPLQARELRFADLADGGVAVSDARDGAAVALIAPGEGGFLRGTVRGLARDRRRAEMPGAEAPFRLAAWPGGGLTLEDTATGRVLDLRAFGATNAGAFAGLLTATRENAP